MFRSEASWIFATACVMATDESSRQNGLCRTTCSKKRPTSNLFRFKATEACTSRCRTGRSPTMFPGAHFYRRNTNPNNTFAQRSNGGQRSGFLLGGSGRCRCARFRRGAIHAAARNSSWRVNFYYVVSGKEEDYWKDQGKYWSKDVDSFLGKKKGISEAVAKIVTASDSPEQKARKIYAFVSQLENQSYVPEPPRAGAESTGDESQRRSRGCFAAAQRRP